MKWLSTVAVPYLFLLSTSGVSAKAQQEDEVAFGVSLWDRKQRQIKGSKGSDNSFLRRRRDNSIAGSATTLKRKPLEIVRDNVAVQEDARKSRQQAESASEDERLESLELETFFDRYLKIGGHELTSYSYSFSMSMPPTPPTPPTPSTPTPTKAPSPPNPPTPGTKAPTKAPVAPTSPTPGTRSPTKAPVAPAPTTPTTKAPTKAPVAPTSPTPGTKAPTKAPTPNSTLPSLAGILRNTADFSTLAAAFDTGKDLNTGDRLLKVLDEATDQYTLFAPTNAAFAAFNQTLLTTLLTTPYAAHLRALLYWHLIVNPYTVEQLGEGRSLDSFGSSQFNITSNKTADVLSLFNSQTNQILGSVTQPRDLRARNGIVQAVDTVLSPPFLTYDLYEATSFNPVISQVTALAVTAGLESLLRTETLTFFAPTNDVLSKVPASVLEYLNANAEILRQVLEYHFVPGVYPWEQLGTGALTTLEGSTIYIDAPQGATRPAASFTSKLINNSTKFTAINGIARNGIAHFIDGLLIPPNVTLPSGGNNTPTPPPSGSTPKLEVAANASGAQFSTLLTALTIAFDIDTRASLLDVVNDPSLNKTVFGPTNDAFTAFDPTLLNLLLTPAYSAHLRETLLWHVTGGAFYSKDLTGKDVGITMLDRSGEIINVNGTGTPITLTSDFQGGNLVDVVAPVDITFQGGVAHSISRVLVPPFLTYSLPDVLVGGSGVLLQLVNASGLSENLARDSLTFFAPTDEILGGLSPAVLTYLSTNLTAVAEIIKNHLVSGIYAWENLSDGQSLTTLGGGALTVAVGANNTKSVNGAPIIRRNLLAANGIAHVIDDILIPSTVVLPVGGR